ncbi:tRNA (guanosine(46)-N7)-methyltransferase TrmB [Nisaea sediminum]|uniref:tRNA (guanosine(46)-N7)-methyltransferase TrmB n=1 Tax=Nisaea sediminum TaxID=2775867 RepID=UPI0029C097E5|nr:tRNA (guanosine(46)-N7)-methyltransferase TrmB [Nisaea sediminum]
MPTGKEDPKDIVQRDRVFYGRRRGRRLRAGMETLLETRLPELRVELPDTPGARLDPRRLFPPDTEEIWLEIGFGGGEHLAAQAEMNPRVGFIGSEPFMNGVASLIRHCEDRGLGNVRIYPDDVRDLLAVLPDGCLDRIAVLFADPWPKKRHHARRIIQHETIAEFHRLLKPGGELRLATDDMGYLRWMLARATANEGFRWLARGPQDWRVRPDDWPETRYEAKARAQGRRPAFMRFERLDTTG